MSFEIFQPTASGVKGIGDAVSLNSTQIYFGKNKPPHRYLTIEFDTSIPAIRFTKGTIDTGYEVKQAKGGGWYIAAYSFLQSGLIPKGRYSRVGDMEFARERREV